MFPISPMPAQHKWLFCEIWHDNTVIMRSVAFFYCYTECHSACATTLKPSRLLLFLWRWHKFRKTKIVPLQTSSAAPPTFVLPQLPNLQATISINSVNQNLPEFKLQLNFL